MAARQDGDLEQRLETYFATLRPAPLKEILKSRVGNWQVYAAVSGSAMAMATGAAAAIIGSVAVAPEPTASVRSSRQRLASSRLPASVNAIRLAMARQDAGRRFLSVVPAAIGSAGQTQAASIESGGVLPIWGVTDIIQPAELISIYGNNLANSTAYWNDDFPTTLGGVSVTIDGKPAYLLYVSPTQINLQAPDDTATGTVPVVVTTPNGTATSTVTLSPVAPAFCLFPQDYVAGIIRRSDGTYDTLGPAGNSFGFPTVAAKAGDRVELYAVGLGPTTPAVPAGKAFSGTAPITDSVSLYINNVAVKPAFAGLTSAGLYQINVIIPSGLGQGGVPIQVTVGGLQTQPGVLFPLEIPRGTGTGGTGGTIGIGPGTGFIGGTGSGFWGGSSGGTNGGGTNGGGTNGGGTNGGNGGGTGGNGGGTGGGGGGGGTGGGGGGSGGGTAAATRGKHYHPRLRFGPNPRTPVTRQQSTGG